jgi:hypothetical protein
VSALVVAPIVEGQGDVAAVPVLLRRIASEVEPDRGIEVRRPIRVARDKVVKDGELERFVELARRTAGAGGAVLIVLDADDDCPKDLAPALLTRAQAGRPGDEIRVVLANREFEAWFLAGAMSLRGRRGLPDDLEPPPDPEAIRDAKGWLQTRRTDGFAYSPTTDQPALAAIVDLHAARATSPSFDKLWRDIASLMRDQT